MKIGVRLTVWGTLITAIACAIVCIALYVGLSASLHNEVDSFLEGEVQEFLAILLEEDDERFEEIERDIRRELGSRIRNDLTFRLLDMQGRIVVSSHAVEGVPNPWTSSFQGRPIGSPWYDTISETTGDASTRTCSMRVALPGRGDFVVQATYSLAGVNGELEHFRNLAIVVFLLAAIGSVVGGRMIARKSLSPVHAMTHAIRRINAADLTQRLGQTGEDDELDQLAGVLNDMLERLERQVNRIRQFTADAAHELRTPLAALRGNAEVALGEHATHDGRRQTLEDSIEEYDRLSRLTEDLLLLARADAGHAIVKRRSVKLRRAIEDVVELFGAVADENGVGICVHGDCDAHIQADPERVRQVLCNIFDNALKFTPKGGHIDIELSANETEARISVSDSGVGIDPAVLPHVFDRFSRADSARTRSTGGFGLGLPICRTIVEAHGGGIEVESEPNRGTRVILKLPVN